MDTVDNTTGAPLDADDAVRAVIEQALSGTPVAPHAARRAHERAARITEEIYRLHGEIDMCSVESFLMPQPPGA